MTIFPPPFQLSSLLWEFEMFPVTVEEKKISKGKIPDDCGNANKLREERKQYRVALKKKMKMERQL